MSSWEKELSNGSTLSHSTCLKPCQKQRRPALPWSRLLRKRLRQKLPLLKLHILQPGILVRQSLIQSPTGRLLTSPLLMRKQSSSLAEARQPHSRKLHLRWLHVLTFHNLGPHLPSSRIPIFCRPTVRGRGQFERSGQPSLASGLYVPPKSCLACTWPHCLRGRATVFNG